MHWIGEEGLEGAPLARRLLLEAVEEVGELGVLLALRQDLSKEERETDMEHEGVKWSGMELSEEDIISSRQLNLG